MLMTRSAPSPADREALVACSGQDHGACAQGLCDGDGEQSNGTGADDDHAFTGNQPAKFGQAVHRGPCGDDKRGFRVAHRVRHPHERVDVIDRVLGKATVGRKAVGAMALLRFPIIEA
jgi:hypothetical protein